MKLNNSIKLAVANFAMFWKILLYKTIAFGLSFLLVLPIFSVLKQAFYMSNFTTLLGSAFTSSVFQNITTVMGQLWALINAFFEGIKILASTNVVALIYFLSPIDFIPDSIPVIGLIDDAAVILFAVDSAHNDINDYRQWKEL